MNNTELVKYEPLIEIVTYENESYFVPKSKEGILLEIWAAGSPMKIRDGLIIASKSIRLVRDATAANNIVEDSLAGKSEYIQNKVREKVREREKEGLPITQGIISNIIDRYANPGNI